MKTLSNLYEIKNDFKKLKEAVLEDIDYERIADLYDCAYNKCDTSEKINLRNKFLELFLDELISNIKSEHEDLENGLGKESMTLEEYVQLCEEEKLYRE